MLLPYSIADIFGLVANVEDYREFLPWCRESRILNREGNELVASIQVVVAGHSEEMITRNILDPHRRIGLELVKGPFSSFSGEWRFSDLRIGCKATLDLSFEFHGWLLRLVGPRAIEVAVDSVLTAFTDQARTSFTPCE